jgi:hypothetical protein
VFIAYVFLKRNTSLRQINLKIRGFERGHSYQVPIGVYLIFIGIGAWLGEIVSKIEEGKGEDY